MVGHPQEASSSPAGPPVEQAYGRSVFEPPGQPVEPPLTSWAFPDPRRAGDELVAVGADLEPGTILAAYRSGLFPMPLAGAEGGGVAAWCPPTRAASCPSTACG